MQWLLGAVLLILFVGVWWDVFARGRRGRSLLWGLSAGVAGAVTAVLQGADIESPWPLLGLIVFVALLSLSIRAQLRPSARPEP